MIAASRACHARSGPALSSTRPRTQRALGDHSTLLGGRLGGALKVARRIERGLAGAALAGSVGAPHGNGAIGLAMGHIHLARLLGSPRLAFAVGPSLGLGYAWASGQPDDPALTRRASGGRLAGEAALGAKAILAVGAALNVALGLEAGVALYGFDVTANGRTIASLAGPFAAVSLGVGLRGERAP